MSGSSSRWPHGTSAGCGCTAMPTTTAGFRWIDPARRSQPRVSPRHEVGLSWTRVATCCGSSGSSMGTRSPRELSCNRHPAAGLRSTDLTRHHRRRQINPGRPRAEFKEYCDDAESRNEYSKATTVGGASWDGRGGSHSSPLPGLPDAGPQRQANVRGPIRATRYHRLDEIKPPESPRQLEVAVMGCTSKDRKAEGTHRGRTRQWATHRRRG